jgi:hypothetical protein
MPVPDRRRQRLDPGDIEASLTAARLAHKAGITVNTYALGPNAPTNPFAARGRTHRSATLPVQNPGNIVSFLQGVSFANVDDVVLTNLTTREVSYDVNLAPDGSFTGFVPVREGRNHVRVTALSSDGSSGSVDLELDFETSGLTERELALELERVRERNKQLMLLVERERIPRFRERQRKELELGTEEGAGGSKQPRAEPAPGSRSRGAPACRSRRSGDVRRCRPRCDPLRGARARTCTLSVS